VIGLSESQGEGHERFIYICLEPFISTKDSTAAAPGMTGTGGSAGWQREKRGCLEVSFQVGHSLRSVGLGMVTPSRTASQAWLSSLKVGVGAGGGHCSHGGLTMLPSSSPSSPSSGGSLDRRARDRRPEADLPLQSWCSEMELRPLAVRCSPGTCSVSGRSKELLASRSREPLWRRSLPAGLARSSSELSSSSWLSLPSPDNRDLRSPLGLLRFKLGARPKLFRLERLLVQLLAALQGLCGELRVLGCGVNRGMVSARATRPFTPHLQPSLVSLPGLTLHIEV
jgi:hypothetical protein